MSVLDGGANGWISSAIARDLLADGHDVIGLVRTRDKADAFAAAGGTPLIGALGDVDAIRNAAHSSDGVIHTAFRLDLSKMKEMAQEESRAIEAFGEALAGNDRPIIVTGGVLLTPPGEVFEEGARPSVAPHFPPASELSGFCARRAGPQGDGSP